jgi:hypothetical protein
MSSLERWICVLCLALGRGRVLRITVECRHRRAEYRKAG